MKKSSAMRKEAIQSAIEVFVAGFSETKSRTWPYETLRYDSVWLLRDQERTQPRDYRKEEWIAFDVEPQAVHRLAIQHTRGHYFVCPILTKQDSAEDLKAKYKSLGYRLLATEPLFVHSLERIPRFKCHASIEILRSEVQAIDFAKANRIRAPKLQDYSSDSYRQYLAYVGNKLVGWVRSIETAKGNWCSNLMVQADFRRQGIAKSLLCKMLRDDRKRGATQSVLLASHTGALLYPVVGYQQCGTLFIFAPRK